MAKRMHGNLWAGVLGLCGALSFWLGSWLLDSHAAAAPPPEAPVVGQIFDLEREGYRVVCITWGTATHGQMRCVPIPSLLLREPQREGGPLALHRL